MNKVKKLFATVTAVMMLCIALSVLACAAQPAVTGITVLTPPERTVYYDGGDNLSATDILCDATGMVAELSYADGTTAQIGADDPNLVVFVSGYVIGENTATVAYQDADGNVVTAQTQVTVKENPIASVEITKMPVKTVYDFGTDVLTKDNFSIEKLYASDPESFQTILDMYGMTYEQFTAAVSDAELAEIVFAEYDSVLMIDTDGMEIKVTYTDGATEVLTDEDEYITHLGYLYPVTVDQKNAAITEGENTLLISVMGKTAEFKVTVTKSAASDNKTDSTQNNGTSSKDDVKNPIIPKTGMTTAVTAAAVLMLVSTASGALLTRPKSKED